ncbi:hypothetical protein HK097_010361, partial [Rhizophlyctis rosea]
MTQYSWAVTQGMTVTGWEDSTIELPSDVPPAAAGRLKAWRIQYPLGVAGWQMQGPKFTAWDSYNVYDTFNLWLQGDPAGIKLQFNNDKGNSLLLDMEACDPYPDPDPNNTLPILQQDSWWKITVSMSQFQVSGLNMIQLIKWNEPAAEIRAVGYFGWPDGVDRTVMPSDLPLPLPLPADLKYKTQSQSYANSGDRGLVCNWHCSDGSDMRPATDLFDVPIYAYRDTSVGPLPMQGMTESTTLENGVYSFQWIWNNTNIKTRLVSDYPSPYYACPALIYPLFPACVEADYYEIGDTSTADYVLTAWIPYNSALGEQLTDPLVSYAQWVKNSRQHDSNVAVIVRMRVPNEAPFNGSTTAASGDWMWVQSVAPDCKNVTYKGFCPDHIWFLDTQMGALHLDLKRLAPLSKYKFWDTIRYVFLYTCDVSDAGCFPYFCLAEWNTQYFKKTGYDISYDMLPAIDKLVYYSGEYYGLPVQIQHPDWHIHYAAVHYLWSMGMKAPPPIDEWGGGWWGEWNMKEFNKIVKVLWDGGYRNIVQLPGNYDVTSFFQYIVSSWGATMLSGTGRCGLDEYAERAITETFVEWLKHPGMLQPRIPWDTDPAIVASWNEWLTSPPKEKPWEEPIFKMKEMSPVETPGEPGSDTSKDFMSFSLASAWGANSTGNPRFIKMYPPTGVAQINGIFAGMARTSRNKTIAHDALMGAIARNKRLQANVALRFGRIWQQRAAVSGYVSAFQLPDYELAIKPSYARMLSDEQILKRASFAGYPVQQFSSFGLIAPFDPINLMFNEIQYKGLSVKEAMDRACQTINWITMPPCGPENWEPYLIDDPTTNQASVHYRWQANKSEVCREDVTLAQSLPSPIVAAVPLTYTSTQSPQAKAMIVLMGIGIALEATMMGLFLWFSNTQVIRAASKIPSVLIFVGAIFTLASVIMRVTTGDRPTWFQCFGT